MVLLSKYMNLDNTGETGIEIQHYYNELIKNNNQDFGNFGLGLFHHLLNHKDSAAYYLNQVANRKLKNLNLILARNYILDSDSSQAIEHFITEIQLADGKKHNAFLDLGRIVDQKNEIDLLKRIIAIPGSENYLGYTQTRKLLLLNNEYLLYFDFIFSWYRTHDNLTAVIAAILILFVWIFYLIKIAFFEKLNWFRLGFALIAEMAFCFFVYLLSDTMKYVLFLWNDTFSNYWELFLYSVFGVGAVEEFVKIIPLLLILAFSKKRIQPFGYILIASFSAQGFAFMENIMYFDNATYGSIIHARALTAAVGHMMFSSIFAYGLVLSKFKYKKLNSVLAFFLFWLLASLAHGLYDFWLFADLIFFFALFFLLISRVWITILNNCLNNSSHFVYSKKYQTGPVQFYLAFALTAILMFEYVIVGFLQGSIDANSALISAAFSGSFLIMFLGSKLSSINLIKGYWGKINYSTNPFTDDVVTQNFVGKKIYLSSYYADRGLAEYIDGNLTGVIAARQVLLNGKPSLLFSKEDSEWFVVKTKQKIQAEGYRSDVILIKFKESYSSLNAKKFFLVNMLLIPKKLPKPRFMRSNFHQLGWTFLRTTTKNDVKY